MRRRWLWAALAIVLGLTQLGGAVEATAAEDAAPPLRFATVDVALGRGGLSAAVAAPVPFSLAGATLPPGASGALRTSLDGRRWSPWLALETDAGGPTDPIWTGPARWLQLRGPAGTGASVHLVDSMGLDLGLGSGRGLGERLASGGGTALRRLGAVLRGLATSPAAAASPARPAIVSRAGWGADERLRRGSPRYAGEVRGLVLHHTAGGNGYRPEHGPAVVRGIYGYHTRVLGWDDIGYHLLVDRYRRLYEGRAGGVDRAVVGAHTGGFNHGTSGVAVLGSFQDAAPPAAALRALTDVLAWKAAIHGIDPRGAVELRSSGSTRYPSGTRVRVPALSGHRDLSRTACPGQALYGRLPELREAVARRMDAARGPLPLHLLPALPAR